MPWLHSVTSFGNISKLAIKLCKEQVKIVRELTQWIIARLNAKERLFTRAQIAAFYRKPSKEKEPAAISQRTELSECAELSGCAELGCATMRTQ
ncbi:TPA: hypothetical protein I7117_00295 [Vibrio vulnificus]|nr:hypothetical protein [Vibrio vulnificus]